MADIIYGFLHRSNMAFQEIANGTFVQEHDGRLWTNDLAQTIKECIEWQWCLNEETRYLCVGELKGNDVHYAGIIGEVPAGKSLHIDNIQLYEEVDG